MGAPTQRPTTPALRTRAELLERGGPELWADYMDELREIHPGRSHPNGGHRSVTDLLAHAYGEANACEPLGGRAG